MKNLFAFTLILVAAVSQSALANETQSRFFAQMKTLCGQTLQGESVFPKDPGDDFAGKKLILEFSHCSKNEMRVPFKVGEDSSRTWIINLQDKKLSLKHDHRLADGSPDPVNLYGGVAINEGSILSQNFIADEHTAKIIPAAKTNVWQLRFDLKAQTLTYYLERHAKPRYKAVFSLKAL